MNEPVVQVPASGFVLADIADLAAETGRET